MRKAGILLHISQLPSKYGIGTLGKEAYEFVDFLDKCGQTIWQMLPLGPTSYGDSPYQTFSAFGGNPYFIDLDFLVSDGLITQDDINNNIKYDIDPHYVNYGEVYKYRFNVLRIAYNNYKRDNDFYSYINDNFYWLDSYAKFMILKNHYNGLDWHSWDRCFWDSASKEVNDFKNSHMDDYYFWCFIQYKFSEQFIKLKEYANSKGIKLIGDIPIYVAYDSSDVWSNHKYFKLDNDYVPKSVAGVPPDGFSETGQLWGNPIYDYEEMEKDNYKWWVDRVQNSFKYFDYLRIDHFRGFEAFWEIPFGDKTAVNGRWVKGPGFKLFREILKNTKDLNIIAEDLGIITPEVEELLKECGFPGMMVLEFGFDAHGDSNYAPHNHKKNCVVYPGTHDNETLVEWFSKTDKDTINYVCEYLNVKDIKDGPISMIRAALGSIAEFAIIMYSDWLELGAFARFNEPNTDSGNWVYRFTKDDFSEEMIDKIAFLTKTYRRNKKIIS